MAVRPVVASALQFGDVNNLPNIPVGETAQVEWMRKVRQMIRENSPMTSDAYGLDRTSLGWRMRIPKSGGGKPASQRRFIIKALKVMVAGINRGADWFYCWPYDKNGEQSSIDPNTGQPIYIKVAKPWELRVSPWRGQTIDGVYFTYANDNLNWSRRKAVSASVTEFQIVVRPWYVGEVIVATTNITGSTAVLDDGPLGDGANPSELVWEDTNSAAHAWAQTDSSDPGDSSL